MKAPCSTSCCDGSTSPTKCGRWEKGRFELVHVAGQTIGWLKVHPGELFYVPPVPHDSWVVGAESYVSLHFLGADQYAK